jgi:hypothetical protein
MTLVLAFGVFYRYKYCEPKCRIWFCKITANLNIRCVGMQSKIGATSLGNRSIIVVTNTTRGFRHTERTLLSGDMLSLDGAMEFAAV